MKTMDLRRGRIVVQIKKNKKPPKPHLRGFGGLQKIRDLAAAGGLTFGELESLTSAWLSSFLAFTRTRVALHVALLFKRHTQIRIKLL